MQLERLRGVVTLAFLAAVAAVPVEAVSLRPNKASDDTVCDLTHDTIGYLGGLMLIPAAASHKDQLDAYFRLAATFVSSKCANGQLLIVQGAASSAIDSASLPQVSNASCAASTVSRTEVSIPFMGKSEPGFELRCVISKRDELAAKLADLEHTDPMASLKARLARSAEEARGTTASTRTTTGSNKDCGKLTLGSLLLGGSCK